MSGLVVGGFPIKVAPGGVKRDRLDGVDRARAFDLTYRASATGNPKHDYFFSTPPLTRADAELYEMVLSGVVPQICSGDIIGGSSNLLLYPEELDNAVWTKAAVTIGTNIGTAPNGTLTADRIEETTANSSHTVLQTVTCPVAQYTLSWWLYAHLRTKCVLSMSDGSNAASMGFDLVAGTTFASGIGVGSWTGISATLSESYGGWRRATVTGTRGAGTVIDAILYLWTTVITYAGTTGWGVYAWGSQLEQAAAATPYVKTTSAAVNTLSVNCHAEITGWTLVKTATSHMVVLDFVLHEA